MNVDRAMPRGHVRLRWLRIEDDGTESCQPLDEGTGSADLVEGWKVIAAHIEARIAQLGLRLPFTAAQARRLVAAERLGSPGGRPRVFARQQDLDDFAVAYVALVQRS